jgi:thiamine biosynthesis lipoprotein ApbE
MAAAAVTDALTTACMLLDVGEIEQLCARAEGLEAWILAPSGHTSGEGHLLRVRGPAA